MLLLVTEGYRYTRSYRQSVSVDAAIGTRSRVEVVVVRDSLLLLCSRPTIRLPNSRRTAFGAASHDRLAGGPVGLLLVRYFWKRTRFELRSHDLINGLSQFAGL
jgi:hypothetical protein